MPTIPRPKLMIPGPVDVDDGVLEPMGAPVAAHYGQEWTQLYKGTTELLRQIFRTQGDVFLLVSSGSGGMEAAVASLFREGQRVLVGVNGFFGERLEAIARSRSLDVVPVVAPWGTPLDPDAVRKAVAESGDVAGIVIVHHETSTGVLNPVREIGSLAQEYGLAYVVDAVSSLGGEELCMDEWGIDICVTASQKCLEAPPGVAPVAVGRRAWQRMDSQPDGSAGWYLNLKVWRQFAQDWGDWHPFPVTLPTNNVLALRAALDVLAAEGLEARIARYRQIAGIVREGIRRMNWSLFVDGEAASSTISVVRRPSGLDVGDLITFLREKRGIRIAGGLGPLQGQIFRVGHMGRAATRGYATMFLEGLRAYQEPKRVAAS